MARKSLEQWINEALVDKEKGAPLSALVLAHMQGAQRLEIHTQRINAANTQTGKDLASLFRDKAEAYAQDLVGVQNFCLMAFYGKNEPEAYQPFLIHGTSDFGGMATEPPNEQGRVQQGMRHNEMFIGQIFRRQQVMDDHAIRMIEAMSRREEALRHENMEAFNIIKELLMREGNMQHERQMAALQYARESEERKKWLSFAPALINTVAGREVFPQATSDTALIEQIIENLDENVIEKLGAVIPPTLWGPLSARMEQAMKKKRLEQEAMKGLPVFAGSPEKDIEGGG